MLRPLSVRFVESIRAFMKLVQGTKDVCEASTWVGVHVDTAFMTDKLHGTQTCRWHGRHVRGL